MLLFFKIKDTFNKALKKGIECDSIHLTDEDYISFCADLKMENVSELTINGIKLTISKIQDRDDSFLTGKKNAYIENALNKKNMESKVYIKIK